MARFRFASLGSGSSGNALVVQVDDTVVLLDCGLGVRDAGDRLARLGIDARSLAAILVTHEHDDHASGVYALAKRYELPVHLTYGTWRALFAEPDARPDPLTRLIDSHSPFVVDDLEILPFPVPHDAREPVQFVFSDGDRRLGVLTDTGAPTRHVADMLSGCDALVIECNHDPQMLARGPYPRWLKARIAGDYGHLANEQSAAIVAAIDPARLKHVVAAHLSERNNAPGIAQAALASALGCTADWIGVADAQTGFDWRDL